MNSTNEILPQGYKITELGTLPEEWEVVRLGEVANVVMGQSPPGSSYNERGKGLPFLQGKAEFGSLHPKHIKYTTIPMKVAPKNSILLSVRAPVGDVNLADIDYCIGRGLSSISLPKGNNIFLFYILIYLKGELEKEGTGSIFKAITKAKLMNFKLPLPPLPEQKRIAAALSAVQEAKEKTQSVIDATKGLKKSMMKHLFTYGPVPLSKVDKVKLKETEIGKVPEEWEVVKLEEIGEFQYGYTASASREKIGPQFLRITDIDLARSKIEWSDVPYCKISDKDYLKYRLNDEDILFTRIGATTGKTCIVKNPPKSVFASYLIRYKVDLKKVIPFFIYYFTTNKEYWDQINASKEGKLKKGVSSSQLKRFDFPLPPLPVQQKIASILSAIDAKIEAEENKKKSLEDLFKTLLHNLMTAKIRVDKHRINLKENEL